MNAAIWVLMVQASLGAFDTLYYHEYKLKLPHGDHSAVELRLHAMRDFLYALIIGSLAWFEWHGWPVWILVGSLITEIIITLWDFVEEDRVRKLPPGERIMHSIMGIVYGAFLALLTPNLMIWLDLPAGFGPKSHGFPSWVLTLIAVGVAVSGIRDLAASFGIRESRGEDSGGVV
jgi:phosphatidylglycerophosphate synthase